MATFCHCSSWQTSPTTLPNPIGILRRWREDSQIAFSRGIPPPTQRSFLPPHIERSHRRARSRRLGCDSLPKGHRRRRHRHHLRRLRSLKVRPLLPLDMVAFWIWVWTAWEGSLRRILRAVPHPWAIPAPWPRRDASAWPWLDGASSPGRGGAAPPRHAAAAFPPPWPRRDAAPLALLCGGCPTPPCRRCLLPTLPRCPCPSEQRPTVISCC